MPRKIRVPEYAKAMGQTYQNVVAKLNRGTLKGSKDKDGRFVLVDDDWDSTIESDQGDIGQEKEKAHVEPDDSTFNEPSMNVELHGTLQTLSKALEGQQHLTANLQRQISQLNDERRELNQGITDDKKRGEKTYFKMITIMLISFMGMGGLVAFLFVWGERSMIRNVDAHKATFEAQKVELFEVIQKREAEFSETVTRLETTHQKITDDQKERLLKLEQELNQARQEALAKTEATHALELKLNDMKANLERVTTSGNFSSNLAQ